ncbi:hypothetical protein BKA56DRAFT_699281 [Ilyonectria sp. MPI-CAGE-AT-0026]|nr:hypothetical protein BKA56DRAFT_699281 [Ilyonectria sp. MPI-CAGE-AT-0026]
MYSWTINGEPQLPRACDRCHAIKERCVWPETKTQCQRCLRLQHVCETNRPTGRPGRKPGRRRREGQPVQSHNSTRSSCHADIPKSLSTSAHVPTDERHLLQRMLSQGRLLGPFSIASSFCEPTRKQVIPHLLLSNTLQDALLACAISWVGDVDGQVNPGRLSTCYQYASSALATLASLQVTNSETMADCLMLGSIVVTFAVKLRVNDISAISARTLSLIAPVYAASDPGQCEPLVFLSCMVMWEIGGCIFHCEVPSLRFKPPTKTYVDRHVGLCGTLLPLFYDICELSQTLAHADKDDTDVIKSIDALEQTVQLWQPAVPEGFITSFQAVEVAHMLCQAQVMRLAALLVMHRLRCPFGLADAPAQALSMVILSQLEMAFIVAEEPVRCVTLALLVACLELKGEGRREWLPRVAVFSGYSLEFGKHVEGTLTSFWATLDSVGTISWCDLTKLGFSFLRN